MRTDGTICLNGKVDGKQPYIEDRIYSGGGCNPAITATFEHYGNWVIYAERENNPDRENMEK